jgi:hypothetical protein
MGSLTFDVAIGAYYTITDGPRNIFEDRLASYSATAPASAFAASPLIVITDVWDTSEDYIHQLEFF